MSLKFREIVCPACNHKFMLSNISTDKYHEYFDKITGDNLMDAICPMCGLHFLAVADLLKGISIDDDRVEMRIIRPI